MYNLLEKLQEEQPEFITAKIADCSTVYNSLCRYAREISYKSEAAVNIFEVNATDSPQFADKSWLELLTSSNDRTRNAVLEAMNNPDYYFTSVKKDIAYKRVGQHTIVSDGCHYRTAVAKAMLFRAGKYNFKGIDLTDYLIDFSMAESHRYLRKLLNTKGLYFPDGKSKILPRLFLRRTDIKEGVGWRTERYTPVIQINNLKTGGKMDLATAKDVLDLISELHSSPILRRFRSNSYAKFLR